MCPQGRSVIEAESRRKGISLESETPKQGRVSEVIHLLWHIRVKERIRHPGWINHGNGITLKSICQQSTGKNAKAVYGPQAKQLGLCWKKGLTLYGTVCSSTPWLEGVENCRYKITLHVVRCLVSTALSSALKVRFWFQPYWASRPVTHPLLTLTLPVKGLWRWTSFFSGAANGSHNKHVYCAIWYNQGNIFLDLPWMWHSYSIV